MGDNLKIGLRIGGYLAYHSGNLDLDAIMRKIDDVKIKFYNSLKDLGLAEGGAPVSDIISKMTDNSSGTFSISSSIPDFPGVGMLFVDKISKDQVEVGFLDSNGLKYYGFYSDMLNPKFQGWTNVVSIKKGKDNSSYIATTQEIYDGKDNEKLVTPKGLQEKFTKELGPESTPKIKAIQLGNVLLEPTANSIKIKFI